MAAQCIISFLNTNGPPIFWQNLDSFRRSEGVSSLHHLLGHLPSYVSSNKSQCQAWGLLSSSPGAILRNRVADQLIAQIGGRAPARNNTGAMSTATSSRWRSMRVRG